MEMVEHRSRTEKGFIPEIDPIKGIDIHLRSLFRRARPENHWPRNIDFRFPACCG